MSFPHLNGFVLTVYGVQFCVRAELFALSDCYRFAVSCRHFDIACRDNIHANQPLAEASNSGRC
jgi:hypothetical protein